METGNRRASAVAALLLLVLCASGARGDASRARPRRRALGAPRRGSRERRGAPRAGPRRHRRLRARDRRRARESRSALEAAPRALVLGGFRRRRTRRRNAAPTSRRTPSPNAPSRCWPSASAVARRSTPSRPRRSLRACRKRIAATPQSSTSGTRSTSAPGAASPGCSRPCAPASRGASTRRRCARSPSIPTSSRAAPSACSRACTPSCRACPCSRAGWITRRPCRWPNARWTSIRSIRATPICWASRCSRTHRSGARRALRLIEGTANTRAPLRSGRRGSRDPDRRAGAARRRAERRALTRDRRKDEGNPWPLGASRSSTRAFPPDARRGSCSSAGSRGGWRSAVRPESLRRLGGAPSPGHPLLSSSANAQRLANSLSVAARRRHEARTAALARGGRPAAAAGVARRCASLRDAGHAMPPEQLRRVLREAWGRDWAQRFQHFDFQPIAAASIGQVHAAVTADGRELALKIQYPGVADSIDSDVDNLATALRLAQVLPGELDFGPLIEQAKRQLRDEADYATEARTCAATRRCSATSPASSCRAVHDDFTTPSILAMDRLHGVPLEDLCGPEHADAQRDQTAALLLQPGAARDLRVPLRAVRPELRELPAGCRDGRIGLIDLGAGYAAPREPVPRLRAAVSRVAARRSGRAARDRPGDRLHRRTRTEPAGARLCST